MAAWKLLEMLVIPWNHLEYFGGGYFEEKDYSIIILSIFRGFCKCKCSD
jgi:hypothetical protein